MHNGIYDHTVALRISTADHSESAAQSVDVSVVLVTEAVCGSGRCSAGEYQCAVGGSCITAAQLCDGVRHCSDGSDEDWHAACAVSSAAGLSHFLVHGQVTIIFVVSVCLFVQSFSQPSSIRFGSN